MNPQPSQSNRYKIEFYSWILSGDIIPTLKTITILQERNPLLDISFPIGPYFINKFQHVYPHVKMVPVQDGYDQELFNKVSHSWGEQLQYYLQSYLQSYFQNKTNKPDLIIAGNIQLQAFRYANKHNIKLIATVPNSYQQIYHFWNFPKIERTFSIAGYHLQYQRPKHSIQNIIKLIHQQFKGKTLIIINSFIGLDRPALVPTNHKFIGLLANFTRDSREISPQLQQWIETWKSRGKNQFVYISFGSMIKLSQTLTQTIYNACLQLQIPIIWSLKSPISSSIQSQYIYHKEWLPQEKILDLPQVRVYLTHCGWSSIGEAISSETPMVCVPIFYDQKGNSELILRSKLGVKIYKPQPNDNPAYLQIPLREQDIIEGISTVLKDKDYSQSIHRMHQLSLTHNTPDLLNQIIMETIQFGYQHLINPTYEQMTVLNNQVPLKQLITQKYWPQLPSLQ